MLKIIDKYKLFIGNILLLLFLGGVFYCALGCYPFLNNNEGLYGEIPRAMLMSAKLHGWQGWTDFVLPRLNGVLYLEKPPLLYWLIAGSYALFGVSEWAARLVPAAAGFVTCVAVWLFAVKQQIIKLTWLPALILATSVGYVVTAHLVMFDLLFTLFLTAFLLLFYLWFEREKASYLRWAYVSLALAVLTKGLIAIVLTGGVVVLFFICEKARFKKIISFFAGYGLRIFFLIAAPWHIAAAIQHDGFAWFYFINEHVLRFLGLREPHDYYGGAFYYYLLRIPIYFFPWSFLLPVLVPFLSRKAVRKNKLYKKIISAHLWRRVMPLVSGLSCPRVIAILHHTSLVSLPVSLCAFLRVNCPSYFFPKPKDKVGAEVMENTRKLKKFLWLWFIFFLLFFSVSSAKANYYLVAGLPPLAFLLALRLDEIINVSSRSAFIVLKALATLAGVVFAAFLIGSHFFVSPQVKIFTQYISLAWLGAIVLYFLFGVGAIWLLQDKFRCAPIFFMAGITVFALFLAATSVPQVKDNFSASWVVEKISLQNRGNIFLYRDFEYFSALPFYARDNVRIIASESKDLFYGKKIYEQREKKGGVAAIFLSSLEFSKLCQAQPTYVVLRDKYAQDFQKNMATQHCNLQKLDERYGTVLLGN